MKAGTLPKIAVNGGNQFQEKLFQESRGLSLANVGIDLRILSFKPFDKLRINGPCANHSARLICSSAR